MRFGWPDDESRCPICRKKWSDCPRRAPVNDTVRQLPALCDCGSRLRLCRGCDDARCFTCDPFGSSDCDATSWPPCAEEVPA